jgi:hypothetical protein
MLYRVALRTGSSIFKRCLIAPTLIADAPGRQVVLPTMQ